MVFPRSRVGHSTAEQLHVQIGMCVFHECQRDICRHCTYSQGFAKAVQMSNDSHNFNSSVT